MKTNCFPNGIGGNSIPFVFIAFILLITPSLWGQDEPPAPYFYLPGGAEAAAGFPLLHTEADVQVVGVIADVKVTQLYQNKGEQPIEAIYMFPASTNAAVYEMKMQLGDRVIEAEIQEKNKAKDTYQKAKSEGRSASLLEQQRPNVFQMKVANIMPGDKIKVELSYTELLNPEEGIYEFVYPTVVGPRYSGETPTAQLVANKWVSNPYMEEGAPPSYSFDFDLCLRAGIPIQEVQSPSHQINVDYKSRDEAKVKLSKLDKFKGNKDFILRYRLKGSNVESGVLLYEGEEEHFFLMTMQPPQRPKLSEIPGREYIFLVDVSGSMSGFPLDVSKKLLQKLIGELRPTDRFNVLLFSGTSGFLSEQSITATPENIEKALHTINSQRGGGGTNMLQAVKKVMALDKSEGFSRSFVILTDGYVTVEADLFDYIRYHLGEANFFAFGIGRSVNRHLIEGLAHVGFSTPFMANDQAEATAKAEQFQRYIQTPVLTNIEVNFQGMEVYDVTPKQIPDLMGERPIVVFGKYRKAERPGARKVILSGLSGEKTFLQRMDISRIKPQAENGALQYLWARHRIKMLGDYSKLNGLDDRDLVGEITGLGLKYNLLTEHTSFVAVDKKINNPSGRSQSITQPLPLPEGVPNSAIRQRPAPSVNARTAPKPVPSSPATGQTSPQSSDVNVPTEESIEDEVEFVDQTLDVTEESDFPTLPPRTAPPPPPPPPPHPEVDEIFKVVEEMPRFPGCEHITDNSEQRTACANEKLMSFVYDNLKYPAIAKENGIEGTVIVQFVIDKDGSIENVRLVRDIGGECGKEVLRIIQLMIDKKLLWIPGNTRGRQQKVQFNLPVKFRLN